MLTAFSSSSTFISTSSVAGLSSFSTGLVGRPGTDWVSRRDASDGFGTDATRDRCVSSAA